MKTKSSSKYYLPLLLFLLMPTSLSIGQVNGISGSKLCVPDAEVVSKGKFEFEPSLSVSHSAKQFDSDWNLEQLNGSSYASSLQFRITLGVAEGLEIGTSFSTAMDEIYVGSKAILFSGSNSAMALIGGFSLPASNKSINDTLANIQNIYSFTFGSAFSVHLSNAASIDMLLSYSKFLGNSQFNSSVNYGAAFGYWASDVLQGVLELNGFSTFNGSLYSTKLAITPGVTYCFSKNLIIVLGDQIDIIGKNDFSCTNTFCAFTMSF
ncbi:MAG: transporter [Ignavibacteriaceae bacterium]